MRKSEVKTLVAQMRDYVPGGTLVEDARRLPFRRTREQEIRLCGTRTGTDIQSGPYFCGAVADWVAETREGTAALCDRHARRLGIRQEEV